MQPAQKVVFSTQLSTQATHTHTHTHTQTYGNTRPLVCLKRKKNCVCVCAGLDDRTLTVITPVHPCPLW